jgi:hypothetical protein
MRNLRKILWVATEIVAKAIVIILTALLWPGMLVAASLGARRVERLSKWDEVVISLVIFLISFLWLILLSCVIKPHI